MQVLLLLCNKSFLHYNFTMCTRTKERHTVWLNNNNNNNNNSQHKFFFCFFFFNKCTELLQYLASLPGLPTSRSWSLAVCKNWRWGWPGNEVSNTNTPARGSTATYEAPTATFDHVHKLQWVFWLFPHHNSPVWAYMSHVILPSTQSCDREQNYAPWFTLPDCCCNSNAVGLWH